MVMVLHFIFLFLSLMCGGCKEGVIFEIVLLRMAKNRSIFKKKKAYASRNVGSIEANQSWKV